MINRSYSCVLSRSVLQLVVAAMAMSWILTAAAPITRAADEPTVYAYIRVYHVHNKERALEFARQWKKFLDEHMPDHPSYRFYFTDDRRARFVHIIEKLSDIETIEKSIDAASGKFVETMGWQGGIGMNNRAGSIWRLRLDLSSIPEGMTSEDFGKLTYVRNQLWEVHAHAGADFRAGIREMKDQNRRQGIQPGGLVWQAVVYHSLPAYVVSFHAESEEAYSRALASREEARQADPNHKGIWDLVGDITRNLTVSTATFHPELSHAAGK